MMKKEVAVSAKWSVLLAVSVLASVLAGCGRGGNDNAGPTTSLAVDPSSIALGQSAVLTWSSGAGATCEAGGGWSGTKPASGTADVTPAATGTIHYTLVCTGGGVSGSSTQSVVLTVEPASAYTATALVENFVGGVARNADPLLVNPWGIAHGPISAFLVCNNYSDTVTIYDGNGRPSPLIVHFDPNAGTFGVTGIVYNATRDFIVGGNSPALFIFAGEGGMIAGWPSADISRPATLYTASDGAVYKGLAVANNGNGNFLYATDFANGKIDVFDATFAKQPSTPTSFAFNDPTLPAAYSPFGIQAVGTGAATRIYVSYAMRAPAEPGEDAPGPGLGIVDAFDANGNLLKHLVAEGGKLNAPWGMALAPADFGTLSNALLVGNFGDGEIHGYDPVAGRYLGTITDGAVTRFIVPGLWGLGFGNDAANQSHATLFFTAGTNGEANGLYGRIDLGEAAPALGTAPVVSLAVPEGDLSGTVTLTADVVDAIAVSKVQFFLDGSTEIATATAAPFSVAWDTTAVGNGDATLRAVATDDNGNVGSSAIVPVVVANAAP